MGSPIIRDVMSTALARISLTSAMYMSTKRATQNGFSKPMIAYGYRHPSFTYCWTLERLQSIVMSMSVCGSVCPRGYLRNHTCDLYQIFVHVACVSASVLLRHVYDRPHRLSPRRGFLPPLKMHYRPGKGDGRAQRGRSMLSTIALFDF